MGWDKFLVDLRDRLPYFPNGKKLLDLMDSEKDSYESAELESLFNEGCRCSGLPIGHDALTAMSRNKFRQYLNRGGKPIMDKFSLLFIGRVLKNDSLLSDSVKMK